MTDPIDDAITKRLEIEFVYDGLHRVVQPAAYGTHKSTGNDVLRAYQIGGSSSSRTPPLWDLFLTARIHDLVVSERTFSDDPPHYARNDKHMAHIFAQL